MFWGVDPSAFRVDERDTSGNRKGLPLEISFLQITYVNEKVDCKQKEKNLMLMGIWKIWRVFVRTLVAYSSAGCPTIYSIFVILQWILYKNAGRWNLTGCTNTLMNVVNSEMLLHYTILLNSSIEYLNIFV